MKKVLFSFLLTLSTFFSYSQDQTVNGNLNVNGIVSGSYIKTLSGTSTGGSTHFLLTSSSKNRWIIGLGKLESGSNIGSDFYIWRYDDAGNFLGNPLAINRSNGNIILGGNVGIGTNTPKELLHVNGGLRWGGAENAFIYSNIDGLGAYIEQKGSNNYNDKIRIQSSTSGDYTNYSQFMIDPNVGFYFTSIGNGRCNVGIGTTTPQYKLAVKGTIGCGEVKVEDVTNWPDFVFKPNYNLRPLSEVEQFIKANNHLPEIPSEAEVKENGIGLGEMNAKLLQKVEELTLYLIEQNKEIIEMKKENEKQRIENDSLKKRVEILEAK